MSDKQLFVTQITDVSDSTSAHVDTLGDIRWVGNKCYKYVLFNNGQGNVAAVAGNACYYFTGASYAANTVTSDATDSTGCAGVFTSVPADGQYCWIQIKGPVTLNQAPTNGADGGGITWGTTSTTDGLFIAHLDNTASASFQCNGWMVDDSELLASLDCPY